MTVSNVTTDTVIDTSWGNDVANTINALVPGDPAGRIEAYIGSSAPTGWLLIQGQTVNNAQSLYPALWAVIPSSWKSGSNMVLPDARQATLGGFQGSTDFANLGGTTGANTKKIDSDHLPTHTHTTPNHTHPFSGTTSNQSTNHTHSTPNHTHTVGTSAESFGKVRFTNASEHIQLGTGSTGWYLGAAPTTNNTGSGTSGNQSPTNHNHPFSGTTTSGHGSGTTGNGGFANDNFNVVQKTMVVNYILRAY